MSDRAKGGPVTAQRYDVGIDDLRSAIRAADRRVFDGMPVKWQRRQRLTRRFHRVFWPIKGRAIDALAWVFGR